MKNVILGTMLQEEFFKLYAPLLVKDKMHVSESPVTRNESMKAKSRTPDKLSYVDNVPFKGFGGSFHRRLHMQIF